MTSLNKVLLIGNVGKDPKPSQPRPVSELPYTTIAAPRSRPDQPWQQRRANYHDRSLYSECERIPVWLQIAECNNRLLEPVCWLIGPSGTGAAHFAAIRQSPKRASGALPSLGAQIPWLPTELLHRPQTYMMRNPPPEIVLNHCSWLLQRFPNGERRPARAEHTVMSRP